MFIVFMPFFCFLGDERNLPSSQELFQYLLVEMCSLVPRASNISTHKFTFLEVVCSS